MKKSFTLLTLSALTVGQVAAQTTLIQEDFEGGSFPGTWSQVTNATDGGFIYGSASGLSSAYFAIDGSNSTNMVATNDDGCNCDKNNEYLIMPQVDLTGLTTVWLGFDLFYGEGTYQSATEEATVVYSTDNGATWTTASTLSGSANWQSVTVDLSAVAGNNNVLVAFHYSDDAGWLFGMAIDNVKLYEPAPLDAGVSNLNIDKYSLAGNVDITGTITNYGSSTITAMDLVWTDGSNTHTDNLTGLSIAPLATYNFTHGTQLAVTGGSNYAIEVYTSLSGDGDNLNDTASASVAGMTFATTKTVVGEEATGTWCGWCPRGHVYMETMESVSSWIGIAVHNADPMVVSTYDAGIGSWIPGYPSGVIDRSIVADPADFATAHAARVTEVSPVDISITNVNLNQATGQLTFDVNAISAVNADVNYRLNAVIVENNVTGTTNAWRQTNYYSFQVNNLPLVGAGHDWQAEPNPVPAADMEYDHVARAILGGFNGTASSVPATITAGSTYTQSYSFTVTTNHDVNNMHIIGMIHDANNNGEILNAIEQSAPVGIKEEVSRTFGVNIYPNPTSDLATIALNIGERGNVAIDVMDVAGKVVKHNSYGEMSGTQNFTFDGSQFESGVYFIRISVGNEVVVKQLNVSK